MFFGGNLWGVAEKLDYLKSMGVGVIYLNPIFKAYSNHKYDTADYYEIDSMFGGREAFMHLLSKAAEADIKIILDGVFNHVAREHRVFADVCGFVDLRGCAEIFFLILGRNCSVKHTVNKAAD